MVQRQVGGAGDPRLAAVEAWFLRRGVPQLIEGYTSERHVDVRARPWLLVWIVSGTVLWWGVPPAAPVAVGLVGIAATLLTLGASVAVARWSRRRVMWWVDGRLEAVEVFVLGGAVAVCSAVVEGSMAAGLLAHTLPVLLILVLFLLFAAELWEAAHLLSAVETLVVGGLLAVVAAVLVSSAFSTELRTALSRPPEQVAAWADGTPAAVVPLGGPPEVGLRPLQRANLLSLVLVGQLLQSLFVAAAVALFLVVVGLVALPAALQDRWVGAPTQPLLTLAFLGETRVLTAELVTVAALLGAVVGLYFTGLAVTDSAYRPSHFEHLMGEVRVLVAAHARYAAASRLLPPGAGQEREQGEPR